MSVLTIGPTERPFYLNHPDITESSLDTPAGGQSHAMLLEFVRLPQAMRNVLRAVKRGDARTAPRYRMGSR